MKRAQGLSLIELLVALAVFSIMAALAYGGLDSIARTRGELAARQATFGDLVRAIGLLDRDLRGAVARPVLGAAGQVLPALVGSSERMEFTRLGYANPQAEPRSNLQRVSYEIDAGTLRRGRYAVLDRAANSSAQFADTRVQVQQLRLRYLDGASARWLDAWPPLQANPAALPRAVQWQLLTREAGELQGTIALVSAWPDQAAGAAPPLQSGGGTTPPLLPAPPGATK